MNITTMLAEASADTNLLPLLREIVVWVIVFFVIQDYRRARQVRNRVRMVSNILERLENE